MFPGTEPTRRPCRRISYRSGTGPSAGPDQRKATELAVEASATSPVGRRTGGFFHGAAIDTPMIVPRMTTTATARAASRRRLFLAATGGDGSGSPRALAVNPGSARPGGCDAAGVSRPGGSCANAVSVGAQPASDADGPGVTTAGGTAGAGGEATVSDGAETGGACSGR